MDATLPKMTQALDGIADVAADFTRDLAVMAEALRLCRGNPPAEVVALFRAQGPALVTASRRLAPRLGALCEALAAMVSAIEQTTAPPAPPPPFVPTDPGQVH